MKNIVVAYDNERAIGANGYLLWKNGEMRGDMQRFRDLTMGSAMIMGRKTFASIGEVLIGRKTIILTRNENYSRPGVQIAHSLNEAYSLSEGCEQIFVIGGGQIYSQAIADVQRIYATEVEALIDGADTYFSNLDNNWQKTNEEEFPSDDNNKYAYRFVTYERIK